MNLQQLEYFKVIAETKSFTRAANRLAVTQPALSKAISKLEEELNTLLFEREGRHIKLTKYGEVFLKYAESALGEIERGIDKLQDMKKSSEMMLSIAATDCIGATFIPFLISNFFNHNVQVKFSIHSLPTEKILQELKCGKLDFGFFDYREDPNKYPEIETVLVKKEEYILIVPKNHHLAKKEEVALKDLKDEYFVVYNNESCKEKISYSEFIDYTPKISAEPSEGSVLSGLVAAGAGIAIILNTPMINTNKLSIIKIKDEIGYKSIYMGWNKEVCSSEMKEQFKKYVLNLSQVEVEG